MPEANQNRHHLGQGPLKTELGSEERVFRANSRRVAFYTLAAVSVVACGLAGYCWYLWAVTARTCVDTYLLRNTTSALLDSSKAQSFQDYLAGLDISSFSAMILALLFTRLAITGIRNTFLNHYRDRASYFNFAYHRVLFPSAFEQLCIRLGLLGTLLSFLLAAISQMGEMSQTPTVAGPPTLEQQAAALSRESEPGLKVVSSGSDVQRGGVTTSQLSSQMFLLLCASLVSTFVGTGAAYIITPSLNWLNDRAVGRHQLREIDPAFASEEFFRQIDRTSERLVQFDLATTNIAASAEQITEFEAGVASAAGKLAELLTGIEKAVRLFEVSNENGKALNENLARVEQLSERWGRILRRLPGKLDGTLEGMTLAGNRLLEASMAAKGAFKELKTAAGTAKKSIEETEHRTMVNWRMLKEVRDALGELARNEKSQTAQVVRLANSSECLGESLSSLSREVERLLAHFAARNGKDGEVVKSLMHIKSQLREMMQESTDGSGDARSPEVPSWWRCLLGRSRVR